MCIGNVGLVLPVVGLAGICRVYPGLLAPICIVDSFIECRADVIMFAGKAVLLLLFGRAGKEG